MNTEKAGFEINLLDYFQPKIDRLRQIRDQIQALEQKIEALEVALDDDEDGIVFDQAFFTFHVDRTGYTADDVNLPNKAVRNAARAAITSMSMEINELRRESIKLREDLTQKISPEDYLNEGKEEQS